MMLFRPWCVLPGVRYRRFFHVWPRRRYRTVRLVISTTAPHLRGPVASFRLIAVVGRGWYCPFYHRRDVSPRLYDWRISRDKYYLN